MAVKSIALNEKLLLSYQEVCSPAFVPCTVRHAQNMVARGLMPAPVRVGGKVMFRRQEVLDWIEAGCPPVSKPANSPTNGNNIRA
jgi:hypothetical protein